MKRREHLCLLALLVVAIAPPLTAGTFERVGLERLVGASSVAVEGDVLSVDSFWDSEGRIIVTEATVYVRDQVMGKAGSVIKVKTFGGTAGGYTVQAPGFPTFEKDEHVFLFLTQDERDPEMMRVTGYQQGQFRIVSGEDNVVRAESAIDGEANLIGAAPVADLLPNELSLEDLKQRVRRQALALGLENDSTEGVSSDE